jgi:hypothetical protein
MLEPIRARDYERGFTFFYVVRFKDDPQVDSLCIPGGFFAEVR